ncbi:MAG: hypothetical protein A2283_21715 [Lentisphaerae bacterium RIFOXYA12_FULL_48_11]|nr:MAG: hypothetical protein A2283_21715 [Lentisphaerae bacterium RIFOXYA12_FULL_48_11]
MFVFDVSDPGNPRELAQIRVPLNPGDRGFRELDMKSKNGLRMPVLPFDPKKKMYSPVCGLVATDGYMYFTGLFSDLHVFHDEKIVKVETGKETQAAVDRKKAELKAEGDFHKPDFEAMQSKVHPLTDGNKKSTNIKHYSCGGQVYAAVEKDGLVYAACGKAGIHVLDDNLDIKAKHSTRGFAMDVQIVGNRLYTAEGSGGLGCYLLDREKVFEIGTYASKFPIRQIRISPDQRYGVIHVGGSSYEIIDISDAGNMRLIRTERGWGGLVYYRQMCNGFIAGKYICGTWCGGRTFMLDLSGNEPKSLPDIMGILPDMEAGGYCSCEEYALLTREGGYSFFKPGFEGKYEDLPVYRIDDGPAFYGKPACRGKVLAVCNRISGEIALVDISDLTRPKLIYQLQISGSPDCAFIGNKSVLIPAGYQGLFSFDL